MDFKKVRSAVRAMLQKRVLKALSAVILRPKPQGVPLTVVPREGYFVDRRGAVRREVAKKPVGMSARQFRKLQKSFRRQAKLHPGMEPVSIGGKLHWVGVDVATGESLTRCFQHA